MGTAAIYKDNVEIGKIYNDITKKDAINMKYAPKSYMLILYLSENHKGRSAFKIVVNSDKVLLSALLTTWDKERINYNDYPVGPEP